MNSVCGKVLGDFARSVLHHHRAVTDRDHAIFGNEHGAEQDPGIRPDATAARTTAVAATQALGSTRGVSPCRPPGPGLPRILGRTPCGTRSSPLPVKGGVPLRDVQEAASHADPRTTMRYDRARSSLDRHATYIVAAYLAGAAR